MQEAGSSGRTGSAEVTGADRWLADERLDRAIDARRRRGDQRFLAEAEATLTGLLVDLMEHRAEATVMVGAGRSYCGRIATVGEDVVVVIAERSQVVVALAAVASVRSPSIVAAPTSTAVGVDGVTLLGLLADHLDDRVVARVFTGPGTRAVRSTAGAGVTGATLGGADPSRGTLVAVGDDVVTIRLDGRGGLLVLAAHAISEVVISATGPLSG